MTHSIEQTENTQSVSDMPSGGQMEAQGAKDKLSTEYVNEIMPRGGVNQSGALNDQGADAPNKLLQQGLADLGSGNGVKGIMQLMRAAQLNPEIMRDQSVLERLHNVVPESAAHSEHYVPVSYAPKAIPPMSASGDQMTDNSQSSNDATQINNPGTDQQSSPAGRQLVGRALTDIASENTVNGILELMQAAQLDPTIMQDARFTTALQTALGSTNSNQLGTTSKAG